MTQLLFSIASDGMRPYPVTESMLQFTHWFELGEYSMQFVIDPTPHEPSFCK